MVVTESEHSAFESRLAKLERSNRRLRLTCGTALSVLAAVIFLGASGQSGITSKQSPVADAQFGTVTVGKLVLLGVNGRQRAVLSADRTAQNGYQPNLNFFTADGQLAAGVGVGGLIAFDRSTHLFVNLMPGELDMMGPPGTAVLTIRGEPAGDFLGVDLPAIGAPSLILTDRPGYQTTLGVTDMVTPATGETHSTSAASVVLFDKNHHVIWQAPQQ